MWNIGSPNVLKIFCYFAKTRIRRDEIKVTLAPKEIPAVARTRWFESLRRAGCWPLGGLRELGCLGDLCVAGEDPIHQRLIVGAAGERIDLAALVIPLDGDDGDTACSVFDVEMGRVIELDPHRAADHGPVREDDHDVVLLEGCFGHGALSSSG